MEGNVNINFQGNVFEMLQKLQQQLGQIDDRVSNVEDSAKKGFNGIAEAVKQISLVQITQGFEQLSNSLNALSGPGQNFQKSMADLSAITGLTGTQLENLGEMARQNAKDFGGDAASSVETYKLLLSQLGPDLAQTPELLNEMARSAETLGKTMGGDTVAATQVLTTAMNQYGVSIDDPMQATQQLNDMMNAMAASAKEGSSELPVLQTAVNVVGGDAKRSGLAFEEMLAAIQLLDKAGKKGAEGGTALRNVLSSLGQGRFLPKDVQEELSAAGISVEELGDKSLSFTDRLRLLQPVANDTALIAKLFGKENQGAAQALIQSADAQDEMRTAISGTNTAFDQASVIMETTAEKQARMQAAIDDAKIAFFEATGGLAAYMAPLAELGTVLAGFVPVGNLVVKFFKSEKVAKLASAVATHAVTAAQWLWNAALNANPIGLVIAGVVALTAAVYAVASAFDTSTGAERANQAIKERVIEKTADERAELAMLFAQLRETNPESEERNRIIDELNQKYPDILSNYDLEKASLEEINAAQQEIIKSIEQRARAEAARELLTENLKKQMELQQQVKKFMDGEMSQFELAGMAFSDDLDDLKAEEDALLAEVMKAETADTPSTPTTTTPEVPGADLSPEAANELKKNVIDIKDKSVSGKRGAKSISVRIDTLVGNLNIQQANKAETMAAIRQQVSEALVGAVRDFEVSIQ